MKTKNYSQFHNDSLLLLHQIKVVSKNRIIKDLFQTISKTPLMEEIEIKLFEIYSPYTCKKYKETLNKQQKTIEEQREEIITLKQQLIELQNKKQESIG